MCNINNSQQLILIKEETVRIANWAVPLNIITKWICGTMESYILFSDIYYENAKRNRLYKRYVFPVSTLSPLDTL